MSLPILGQDEDATQKYRKKDLEQLEQYEDGDYPFPPKPKSNLTVGVKGGLALVYGDVRPQNSFGGALDIRKGLGHAFALRLQAGLGRARGLNFDENSGYQNHNGNPWNENYFEGRGLNTAPNVFYNYQMTYGDLSIQGIFNLNNLNFYKEQNKWNLYAGIGFGIMGYNTRVDALNGNDPYNFSPISAIALVDPAGPGIDGRTQRLDALGNLLDGEYESQAESHNNRPTIQIGDSVNYTLNPTGMVVAGVRYRASRRIEIEVEYRLMTSGDDLLDGERWQEIGGGSGPGRLTPATSNFDALSNIFIGIMFRLGKGEDDPSWVNPMNQLYTDVQEARETTKKLTEDSDNDGIPDLYDKEPDTPEGAPVTATGETLDSDGDGYADNVDDEPFSPKNAEVDANGVAIDSDNDGVPDIFDKEPNSPPGMYYDSKGVAIQLEIPDAVETPCLLPIIHFELNRDNIQPQFYPEMYYIAQVMKNDPGLKVKAVGYADARNTDAYNLDLSQRRVNNAISFLVNTYGIEEGRFIIEFKGEKEPLIDGLPENGGSSKLEPLYYVNRRVVFECVKE
ncbi:MAG: OmpA family protein [Bacteroidota bacterium]